MFLCSYGESPYTCSLYLYIIVLSRTLFCMNCINLFFHRWLLSVNGQPGLNTEFLSVLQAKARENPETYGKVCLMIDGMSIKQQVVYDNR